MQKACAKTVTSTHIIKKRKLKLNNQKMNLKIIRDSKSNFPKINKSLKCELRYNITKLKSKFYIN